MRVFSGLHLARYRKQGGRGRLSRGPGPGDGRQKRLEAAVGPLTVFGVRGQAIPEKIEGLDPVLAFPPLLVFAPPNDVFTLPNGRQLLGSSMCTSARQMLPPLALRGEA